MQLHRASAFQSNKSCGVHPLSFRRLLFLDLFLSFFFFEPLSLGLILRTYGHFQSICTLQIISALKIHSISFCDEDGAERRQDAKYKMSEILKILTFSTNSKWTQSIMASNSSILVSLQFVECKLMRTQNMKNRVIQRVNAHEFILREIRRRQTERVFTASRSGEVVGFRVILKMANLESFAVGIGQITVRHLVVDRERASNRMRHRTNGRSSTQCLDQKEKRKTTVGPKGHCLRSRIESK